MVVLVKKLTGTFFVFLLIILLIFVIPLHEAVKLFCYVVF